MKKEFGILLFGFSRPLYIADVLQSLEKQGALEYVDVWIDGHQGNPELKAKVEMVSRVVDKFSVNRVYRHNGNLGFRKLMLQALSNAVNSYEHIMILEDDCFPSRNAVKIFKEEIRAIEDKPNIFSVYGHPFLVDAEKETCPRFQGWGWGTTSNKLRPFLEQLIDCYSLSESAYLSFIEEVLTDDVKLKIDVTPPRLPSHTLTKFFAWDETLGLLTALAGKEHKLTSERTIYNCGACKDSSRFKNVGWYMKPPFNMVSHDEIWNYF